MHCFARAPVHRVSVVLGRVTSCATSARALIGVGAFQVWNYYPAYQYGSTAAGQLARLLDPELDIRFQNIQLSLYGYGGAAILGVIISAYCLSQKDTTETVLPEAPIPKPLDDALEIARNRFARGEITAEEFEEMKRRLSG